MVSRRKSAAGVAEVVPGASIRVVSARTGIPADTLRVWERRYGFPKPSRRAGGSRVYTEADIARLRLVSAALSAGFRPSEAVPLPPTDLARLVEATRADTSPSPGLISAPSSPGLISAPSSPAPSSPGLISEVARRSLAGVAEASVPGESLVEQAMEALQADDIVRLRATLRKASIAWGPRAFVTELAHPFVVRVGEMWAEGRLEVRHEHLATACLTSQLQVLLASMEDGARRPAVLLAALPTEQHLLGLDMIAVYLATSLAAPRLLGTEAPPEQIVAAARALDVAVLGIGISAATDARIAAQALQEVAARLPARVALWVGGAGATSAAAAVPRARVLLSFHDVDAALAAVRE